MKRLEYKKEVSAQVMVQYQGVSGVLAADPSSISNHIPVLWSLESLRADSEGDFLVRIGAEIGEVTANYVAVRARNAIGGSGLDKIGWALLFSDLAEGTATYKELGAAIRKEALNALLDGPQGLESYVFSVNLTPIMKRRIAAPKAAESHVQNAIEEALKGLVAIETDAGGKGSGFFVTENCLVVTNAHVVENAQAIVVRPSAGGFAVGHVVISDEARDVAVIEVSRSECIGLSLNNGAAPTVGTEIYALGSPLGLSQTVTRGIVSSVRTGKDDVHYVQVDASLNPGNSGGPIINRDGLVVAMSTFKVSEAEGLSFGVAAQEVLDVIARTRDQIE